MGNSSSISLTGSSTPNPPGEFLSFESMVHLVGTHKLLEDSSNYRIWLNQLEPLLIGSDLYKFVDGSSTPPLPSAAEPYGEWLIQDQRVRALLHASLTPEAAAVVVGCRTSRQIWSTLQSKARQIQSRSKGEKLTVEEAAASTFTCELCIQPSLLSDHFHHKYNCSHGFCVACISSHMKAKIEENTGIIHCPALECDQVLDPIECQAMIPPELFIKWCDRLCEMAVSDANTRYYCPNQSCSELILNECDDKVKKCKCPRCKGVFCYECMVLDANDRKFGHLLEKMKWTRCPKCGQPVDRISGCSTIRCRCGCLFCHKCGNAIHGGSCACVMSIGESVGIFIVWGTVIMMMGLGYYLGPDPQTLPSAAHPPPPSIEDPVSGLFKGKNK